MSVLNNPVINEHFTTFNQTVETAYRTKEWKPVVHGLIQLGIGDPTKCTGERCLRCEKADWPCSNCWLEVSENQRRLNYLVWSLLTYWGGINKVATILAFDHNHVRCNGEFTQLIDYNYGNISLAREQDQEWGLICRRHYGRELLRNVICDQPNASWIASR